ncbi:MAG: hypothetical protein U5K31_10460 [Balneolaceae bacterium]|nr:hypothetical protein [Balneolaceae bacterium]
MNHFSRLAKRGSSITQLPLKLWAGAFVLLFGVWACAPSSSMQDTSPAGSSYSSSVVTFDQAERPSPDPRVGLEAGLFDAEEAIWNMRKVSHTPPPEGFLGVTNSDLAFKDNYAIQGNYNGFMVWDISNPASPELVVDYLCPASQSDVSIYENLLFVSGEGYGGRLDCGTEGVDQAVSQERLRGIRIFDVTDLQNPQYIANVQTCRGSHTHSVLKDPDDNDNVYVYVSGSASVRPEEELPGCVDLMPDEDPSSALFRIEVIQVPLDNPEQAAIVSSPRIFEDLVDAPSHGLSPADLAEIEEARQQGAFVADVFGRPRVLSPRWIRPLLEQVVAERGGTGEPTAADSAALRETLAERIEAQFGGNDDEEDEEETIQRGPDQCHDITLYPEIDLAGGACEGYGLLLDISDPANPVRIDAVADSNFSYWHSATFNNDGTKVLFTDEWGGGSQPKCRELDPYEWGANAIFTVENGQMNFESYYKLPAPQTTLENCVAHNGSLIPIPGRDIMVQAWYQGGISIFDWTDPENPIEIAFHDRGPLSAEQMESAGSWSVYWYNGSIVSSEIARGLDIFELTPSDYLTQNEIDAANTVRLDYLNAQGQPKYVWPASFALAKSYLDQLERGRALDMQRIGDLRQQIAEAENASGSRRARMLRELAGDLESTAGSSSDATRIRKMAEAVRQLAAG